MRAILAVLAAAALVGAPAPAAARPRARGHSERLAARARRGDRAARAALVEEHMGLVRSVAFRYRDLGLPVDDLVQEGAIGLLTAIDGYDSSRGASFSTYAFWRVRAAVTHAITAQSSPVRIPRTVRGRRRGPAAAAAEALAPIRITSLDRPLTDGTRLVDRIAADPGAAPETLVLAAEQAVALRGALRRLRPRLRAVVKRHYGIDGEAETLTAIARDLRLSPERTRALKDRALRELAADLGPA